MKMLVPETIKSLMYYYCSNRVRLSVKDLISKIKEKEVDNSYLELIVDYEDCDENPAIHLLLRYDREETDEEYYIRRKEEDKQIEIDYQLYLELKQRFEPNK